MKFYFFSKLFRIRGDNNATDSNGVHINLNKSGLSDYCREMISKLMDENSEMQGRNMELRKKLIESNRKLDIANGKNDKLEKLLKSYINGE